ncbi:MAG: hypothetical protein U1E93_13225 [Alphaproteobacteria bacterium]
MRSKAEIEQFVRDWVASNVHLVPELADVMAEIDRLASNLTGDARAQGISGRDLNTTVGDIDDYLAQQYHAKAG